MSQLSRSFRGSIKGLSQDVKDNTDNIQRHAGQTLRQAGNKPESIYSHKPGPVQSACYRPLENYFSKLCSIHLSINYTCSVEVCLNTLLCCMCITQCWQQLSLLLCCPFLIFTCIKNCNTDITADRYTTS